ncbi:response regulator [candidate division KSB1 bacterium]|nr:response regulator [candidate division KSB1 bacterium]
MVPIPKGTVLLIEEDLRLQQYLAVTLRLAGYEARFARDAMEGFAALQTYHVDVIAINFRLPDMNCLQFLETLLLDKNYHNAKGVPVIVMTAFPIALNEKWRLYRMGVKAVFLKENGFEEMVALLQRELDTHGKVLPLHARPRPQKAQPNYLSYLEE